MNRVAQLVEIVQVILPLLVQDIQHHERQQPVAVPAALIVLDRVEVLELRVERARGRADGGSLHRRERRRTQVGRLELGYLDEVVHQQVLTQQVEVPVQLRFVLRQHGLDARLDRLLDHLQRLSLQLLSALERERPQ